MSAIVACKNQGRDNELGVFAVTVFEFMFALRCFTDQLGTKNGM